jgi:serine/threonine protein kinase
MAGRFGDAAFRRLVMPQLADLVTTLATHGWFFRDLQLANLVLDGDTVRLIDVGSIRRLSGPRQVHRMIAMLVRSLHIDGAGLRNMARLTGLAVGRPLRDHRMMLEYLRSLAPLEDPRS